MDYDAVPADALATLLADLEPLLACVRDLDLGEIAVANTFDPSRSVQG